MYKQTLIAAMLALPLGWAQAQDAVSEITISDSENKQIVIERGDSARTVELHKSDGQVVILEPGNKEEIHLEELDGVSTIVIRGDGTERVIDLDNIEEERIIIRRDLDQQRRVIARSRSIGDRVSEMAESIGEWAGQLGESIGESFSGIGDREYFAKADFGNSREMNETVPMQPGGRVIVENIAGTVVVQGWDKEEIQVVGTIGEDVEDVSFNVRENDARIEVEVPNGRNRKIRTDLTISVPRRSSLSIETVSAKIEVRGVEAASHRLESISGSVEASDTTGSMDIETVSGQVTVNDADAHLKIDSVSGSIKSQGDAESVGAETVSGSVQILGVRKEVRVDSISGSIKIQGDGLEDFEVETVSGSVTFDGTLAQNTGVEIHSISGSITLNIDGDLPSEYDLRTASGSINCSFGPEVHKRRGAGQEHRFDLGTGGGEVRIETFSGSITIRD